MFTWAYNQLSQSWENALTDTDGAYCELMAGSYSDNQPDFTWLEPMETKPSRNIGSRSEKSGFRILRTRQELYTSRIRLKCN